jgi:hypothetical protein
VALLSASEVAAFVCQPLSHSVGGRGREQCPPIGLRGGRGRESLAASSAGQGSAFDGVAVSCIMGPDEHSMCHASPVPPRTISPPTSGWSDGALAGNERGLRLEPVDETRFFHCERSFHGNHSTGMRLHPHGRQLLTIETKNQTKHDCNHCPTLPHCLRQVCHRSLQHQQRRTGHGPVRGCLDSQAPFIIQISKGARKYTDKRMLEAIIRAAEQIFPGRHLCRAFGSRRRRDLLRLH